MRMTEDAGSPCDVVTLGETMVLLWPTGAARLEDAATYERSLGGAESNLAIALARLGLRPRWISRLGDDPFGRYTRATLEREGVVVDAPVDVGAPTAVFFKERIAQGPRRVYYYRRSSAASRMDPGDLTPAQFTGARLLHLTGITPALSAGCAATVDRAIMLARAAGARVCVDPNVRPQLWPEPAAGVAALHALMTRADLVLLGDEDAAYLFPGLSDTAVLDAVRARSCSNWARGARGRWSREKRLASRPIPSPSSTAWARAMASTRGSSRGFCVATRCRAVSRSARALARRRSRRPAIGKGIRRVVSLAAIGN